MQDQNKDTEQKVPGTHEDKQKPVEPVKKEGEATHGAMNKEAGK